VPPPQAEDVREMEKLTAPPPPTEPESAAMPLKLSAPTATTIEPRTLWLAVYGLVALGFAASLLMGYLGLRRLTRQSRPAPPALERLLDEVLPPGQPRPLLRLHDRLALPISFGLWRSTILLPVHFERIGSPAVCAAVLAHELTHLARRDAWSSLLFGLGQVLYFPMPWFWVLRRQVRLAQEYIADAAATRLLSAIEYAQVLVDWSARCQRRPSPGWVRANGVFQCPSDLSRRVAMLLREESRAVERRCPRWWTMSAALLFLLVAAVATGVKLQAEPPEKSPPLVWLDELAEPFFFSWTDDDEEPAKDPKKEKFERPFPMPLQPQVQVEKLDAPIKALTATLERLGDRADAETRKALEETKRQLEDLRRQWQARLLQVPGGPWITRVPADVSRQLEMARARLQELRTQIEQLRKEWGDESEELKEARKRMLEALEKRYKEMQERLKQETEKARVQAEELRLRVPRYYAEVFPTSRGRLGLHAEPVPTVLAAQLRLKENTGLVVVQVSKDSPAEKAGIKQHDIILEMNGQPVSGDVEAFRKAVRELKADAKIDLKILRAGQPMDVRGIEVPPAKPEEEQGNLQIISPMRFPDFGPLTKVEIAPAGKREATTVVTIDRENAFTINHSEGKVKITLTGRIEDGKPRPSSVTIREGGQTTKYKSVDEVPGTHKETVEKLLKNIKVKDEDPGR
jgi:beta-lactamase regulating signal transducer with metallopeptidase domain/ElaB/YqjD/DUF883 family membrane-anchored ribosome-binding protein